MGLKEGDYVVLAMYWTDSFPTFAAEASQQSFYHVAYWDKTVYFSLKVLGVFEGTQGKWPTSYKNGNREPLHLLPFPLDYSFCVAHHPFSCL